MSRTLLRAVPPDFLLFRQLVKHVNARITPAELDGWLGRFNVRYYHI
jgi:hypothetical protein